MRSWLGVSAIAVLCAMALGTAFVGPATGAPGAPDTGLSADHYGVLAGSDAAPVQLELFCDPQCPECAKFEAASGAEIGLHLGDGRLAVTYRWLTFLDERRHNDVSARVSNALMAAADPATSATAYQAFVADLYAHQQPGVSPGVAEIADESGVPHHVVQRIAAIVEEEEEPAVDTTSMNAFNRVRLRQVNPEHPGTPTVYDLKTNTVVDTDDPGWLDRLVSARLQPRR